MKHLPYDTKVQEAKDSSKIYSVENDKALFTGAFIVKWRIKVLLFGILLTVTLLGGLSTFKVLAAPDPFPIYECLEPNVEFWIKVFTQYSSRQGIIHDNWNLSVIYDITELQDGQQRGARKINKDRIRKAKKKYKNILKKLARGDPPSSSEEKRVADLFGPNATHNGFRKAEGNIRCQIGLMDRFREGLLRSGALLDQIKEIFESYGLPSDLAYLPHVESSFNPSAYSKFGAAGIWQFIRSTGKRLLEIGYTLDERRDPIRSTHAAAQLMKENYKILGTWPMAITAYNHGLAGMLRAKRAKGDYKAIFSEYRSRLFKFASRNFYSEFLAALYVAKNYREYFGDLELHKPFKSYKIVTAGYLPMKDLVRHFDFDIAVIKTLNPSLRKPVYTGQKYIPEGYTLRLPIDAGKSSKSPLSELPQHLYKHKQKRSLFCRVQRGDTASEIAKAHDIELSELILANNLDSRATILVGQNLRLPSPDEKFNRLTMIKTTTSVGSREKLKTNKLPINLAVVTGSLPVEKVTARNGRSIGAIRVEVEETLGHYADWLGVATQEIRKLNGFRYGRVLRMNEPVRIPLNKISKEKFEEKRFEYHKEIEEDFFASYKVENVEIYKIKNGDTIWTLCHDDFEVPLWLIIKYNPKIDFNNLRPTQELLVPVVEEKRAREEMGSHLDS